MTDDTDITSTDDIDITQRESAESGTLQPEGYLVPEDADIERCPHCNAPFTDPDLLALHLGVEHDGSLTDDQQARFEEAHETESEEIRLFRLKALGLLVLLYFALLMAFSVFA